MQMRSCAPRRVQQLPDSQALSLGAHAVERATCKVGDGLEFGGGKSREGCHATTAMVTPFICSCVTCQVERHSSQGHIDRMWACCAPRLPLAIIDLVGHVDPRHSCIQHAWAQAPAGRSRRRNNMLHAPQCGTTWQAAHRRAGASEAISNLPEARRHISQAVGPARCVAGAQGPGRGQAVHDLHEDLQLRTQCMEQQL